MTSYLAAGCWWRSREGRCQTRLYSLAGRHIQRQGLYPGKTIEQDREEDWQKLKERQQELEICQGELEDLIKLAWSIENPDG